VNDPVSRVTKMKSTGLAAMILMCIVGSHAQSAPQEQAFEVASIRRSDSLDAGGTLAVQPGGRFFARNIPVRSLISTAYDVPTNRVLDVPSWTLEERYIVEARAEGDLTWERARSMLISLLRDRFGVVARKETRELPVYTLVTARPDRALGPRMRRSDVDCFNAEARAKAQAAAAPGRMVCGIRFDTGRLMAGSMSIANLVTSLSGASGRPVIDRTSLAGSFDIELEWAATPDVPDAVSIFTAVQEQLGLKLESDTAALDVVVVERVERPTEN
jgi:uncharacterized protein (TIGR03435 family)